jgi:hypothetical protein
VLDVLLGLWLNPGERGLVRFK